MHDFFIRDEDQRVAANAVHMDDLDMIISDKDGSLVPVAMKHGKHVCWACGGGFDESKPKFRKTEVQCGYVRILLHAQCENGRPKKFSMYRNNLRGLQIRRRLASAAKASQNIATAALGKAHSIIS